jgi:hypothetical protein
VFNLVANLRSVAWSALRMHVAAWLEACVLELKFLSHLESVTVCNLTTVRLPAGTAYSAEVLYTEPCKCLAFLFSRHVKSCRCSPKVPDLDTAAVRRKHWQGNLYDVSTRRAIRLVRTRLRRGGRGLRDRVCRLHPKSATLK